MGAVSRAWTALVQHFGSTRSQKELLVIALVVSEASGVQLDREAKRRKAVLVNWFDENLDRLLPHVKRIELYHEKEMVDMGTRVEAA